MPYIGQAPTSVAFLTDTFSGNGSTTAFTMSVAPANTASVLVAVSGVLQDPSTYSVVGTTLTFSGAPPTGTGNISARYLGIPASGVTTTAYRTITEFTATAGQTTFTPPSYTVGFIQVFRNGVLLGSADYTATNGTTVVLTTGATSGDLVTTESFYVSSVLNAIPAVSASIQQSYIASGVAGTGPAFSAYLAVNQSIPAVTITKVAFDTKVFDTNTNFSTANSRFTPTIAGYYQMTFSVYVATSSIGVYNLNFYKNGGLYKQPIYNTQTNAIATMANCTTLVYMNGSTDYLEAWFYSNNASTLGGSAGSPYTEFSGALVRAA